ncbi:hypothetical protein OBP_185 [Pseudomonas phage OBP]|uniref:hypothetical protein n=1 Tax=Pseudomonas phage OBP TaxID=1124849 RepID=UPI000240D599|nr:hypothetical protein OBP_185 [Pseudomonas phage OBP]AEV89622.1 hypothetical protein OBP_185 [Pseudomonas phage OBP]
MNNWTPTKMVSALADEEHKLYPHHLITAAQNTTVVNPIVDHAFFYNISNPPASEMENHSVVAKRMAEIEEQLTGFTPDDKVRTLSDLRDFFYKRLCRAQHSGIQAAVVECRNLLQATRLVETSLL